MKIGVPWSKIAKPRNKMQQKCQNLVHRHFFRGTEDTAKNFGFAPTTPPPIKWWVVGVLYQIGKSGACPHRRIELGGSGHTLPEKFPNIGQLAQTFVFCLFTKWFNTIENLFEKMPARHFLPTPFCRMSLAQLSSSRSLMMNSINSSHSLLNLDFYGKF